MIKTIIWVIGLLVLLTGCTTYDIVCYDVDRPEIIHSERIEYFGKTGLHEDIKDRCTHKVGKIIIEVEEVK